MFTRADETEGREIHLKRIHERVTAHDPHTIDPLKKIPARDSKRNGNVRPDWFTKDGYYTTSTAYKIATVSAWLRIYQPELRSSSAGAPLLLPPNRTSTSVTEMSVGVIVKETWWRTSLPSRVKMRGTRAALM
jgi:hypothetical protein